MGNGRNCGSPLSLFDHRKIYSWQQVVGAAGINATDRFVQLHGDVAVR